MLHLTPTPPLTVWVALVTCDGLVAPVTAAEADEIVIFAGETSFPDVVVTGLVPVISGETTATGVLLEMDVETKGEVSDGTTGIPLTGIPLGALATVLLVAVDKDDCVREEEGDKENVAATLAAVQTDCADTGV